MIVEMANAMNHLTLKNVLTIITHWCGFKKQLIYTQTSRIDNVYFDIKHEKRSFGINGINIYVLIVMGTKSIVLDTYVGA